LHVGSTAPDAEAGAAVIECLHVLGAFLHLHAADELVCQLGHDGLRRSRNEKAASVPQQIANWCQLKQMIFMA
jgi:hypothetical protein